MGESTTLMCKAIGTGTLVYSWERSSGSSWTTVSNDNTTSYTTDTTLAIGQYMYRCRVSNDAGSVVSNNAIVNVYGEYCCSWGEPERASHWLKSVMVLYVAFTDCENDKNTVDKPFKFCHGLVRHVYGL